MENKCDIIIPIYNSPEWVKMCVYALFKNTPYDVIGKVILMNDNSDELTCNCIENLKKKYPELNLKKLDVKEPKKQKVEAEFKEIYDILSYEEAIHINEISRKLQISISEINSKLIMLELDDKIVSLPGSNYKKK